MFIIFVKLLSLAQFMVSTFFLLDAVNASRGLSLIMVSALTTSPLAPATVVSMMILFALWVTFICEGTPLLYIFPEMLCWSFNIQVPEKLVRCANDVDDARMN